LKVNDENQSQDLDPNPDPSVRGMDLRIRIYTKWVPGFESRSGTLRGLFAELRGCRERYPEYKCSPSEESHYQIKPQKSFLLIDERKSMFHEKKTVQ
jgi:hypothetical protein